MQNLKQNYLLPGFQTEQSQMLGSVQTSLFLTIPVLETLLKNCTFTSVLQRITENFTICFRESQSSKASQKACRG